MKNIMNAMVVGLLFTVVLIGCNKKNAQENIYAEGALKVAYMVSGNLGDLSFFDSAANGIKKLQERYGDKIVTKIVEASTDDTKWEPTLEDLSDQDWDIIIVGTWNMIESLERIAPEHPDKRYIIFDSAVDYSSNNLQNVYSIMYKQNEASFLAGILAARLTVLENKNTNPDKKIGFLGGLDIPVINDFLVGYIQGAQYISSDINVLFSYVGDFNDSAKGKEIALVQYNQGVDVGFNVAGTAGLGQLDAAKETNKYVIGVDSDQAMLFEESDPAKSNLIVTSVLKRIDNTIVRSIEKHLDGVLPYGSVEVLGLAEEAVGLADNQYYRKIVPKNIQEEILSIQDKIIAKEIVVDSAFGMSVEKLNAIKDSVR